MTPSHFRCWHKADIHAEAEHIRLGFMLHIDFDLRYDRA